MSHVLKPGHLGHQHLHSQRTCICFQGHLRVSFLPIKSVSCLSTGESQEVLTATDVGFLHFCLFYFYLCIHVCACVAVRGKPAGSVFSFCYVDLQASSLSASTLPCPAISPDSDWLLCTQLCAQSLCPTQPTDKTPKRLTEGRPVTTWH